MHHQEPGRGVVLDRLGDIATNLLTQAARWFGFPSLLCVPEVGVDLTCGGVDNQAQQQTDTEEHGLGMKIEDYPKADNSSGRLRACMYDYKAGFRIAWAEACALPRSALEFSLTIELLPTHYML